MKVAKTVQVENEAITAGGAELKPLLKSYERNQDLENIARRYEEATMATFQRAGCLTQSEILLILGWSLQLSSECSTDLSCWNSQSASKCAMPGHHHHIFLRKSCSNDRQVC